MQKQQMRDLFVKHHCFKFQDEIQYSVYCASYMNIMHNYYYHYK